VEKIPTQGDPLNQIQTKQNGEMSEILTLVITSLITFVTTGGIGSIFYFRLQKRMKLAEIKAAEVEVKSAEINNLSASNEEWIKLYHNCNEEKIKLEEALASMTDKLDDAYKQKDLALDRYGDSRTECNKKDMVIAELNWYRCEVNGCPYRKPPRKFGEMDFPKDAINPVENPDPNYIKSMMRVIPLHRNLPK
jgi:hypothetical protein